MEWTIAIIALLVFIFFSYRQTLWGVSLVIVLLPTYLWRLSMFGLPTTFLELIIIALFIIWLVKDKLYKKINLTFQRNLDNRFSPILRWLLILWLLAGVAAVIINPAMSALGLWRAYWLEPIMFLLVFVYSVQSKRDLQIIFKSIALLVTWLLVVAIYQYFTGWNLPAAYDIPNIKRLTTVFSYPNALGLLLAPLSALFFGLWLTVENKLINWWLLAVAIISLLLCWFAKSEGALLGIGFSLFIWLILAKKIRKLGLVIIVFAIIFSFFNNFLISNLSSFKQQLFAPQYDLQATSLEIRSSQWSETWAMLQDNWFWGAGLNNYQAALEPYHQVEWIEIYLYPHNIVLNFWSEIGLVGLFIFILIIFYLILILRKLFLEKNILAWSLTMMWLTWFIHGLVDVPYFKNDLSVLFFIMLGLTLLAEQYRKNDKTIRF
jgi:O-antigen ligase